MSRILLLGLNSFSGYRFAESFGNKHAIIGTLRNSDGCPVPENVTREVVPGIMDQRQMETLLAKYAPEVIINFLAMGNVDECERNQDEAKSINLDFPIALARVLKEKEQNCLFVQVSSNAVYDGDSPPYSEDSPKHPVNFYGETKA
ncbi:MAG: sugar nucleotide-binding protein, partial [Leptospiraceae bacterium]|nr:sugar nucleotide-binding protein [Leptospiraceae bacterium]